MRSLRLYLPQIKKNKIDEYNNKIECKESVWWGKEGLSFYASYSFFWFFFFFGFSLVFDGNGCEYIRTYV